MTKDKKIEILKTMCDEEDEELLGIYLDLAQQAIYQKAFPYHEFPDEFPSRWDDVHLRAAGYLINKRGAEGESVHLENTIHRHYTDADIPTELLRMITPRVGVI